MDVLLNELHRLADHCSWEMLLVAIDRPFRIRSTGVLDVLCPEHGEKTPSLHLWPTSGRFYCHGCGWSGNKIDFIAQQLLGYDRTPHLFGARDVEKLREFLGHVPSPSNSAQLELGF